MLWARLLGTEGKWQRVLYASDCVECPMCGEELCPYCDMHYSQCPCPGPHQEDEYEYTETPPEGPEAP